MSIVTVAMDEDLFNTVRQWALGKKLIIRPLNDAAFMLCRPHQQPPTEVRDNGNLWAR